MTVDVQALVEQGYWRCSTCSGLNRPANGTCKFCSAARQHADASAAAKVEGGVKAKRETSPRPKATALNPEARRGQLGSLAAIPERRLTLVVYGTPVSQGSLNSVAPGVMKRENGSELEAWRNAITREALRVCGSTWVAANDGVRIDLVFTVPAPKGAPTRTSMSADGYRDLDKLTRAVGDALCPSITATKARFRVLASDMRIVGHGIGPEKTHPRPLHTHPLALDRPGVVIRITPAEDQLEAVVRDGDRWVMVTPCLDPHEAPVSDSPHTHSGGTR